LFLKGERCLTPKCAFERRPYPPGQHGRESQYRRGRASDYSMQLREKQKARRIYGVLERQFRRYFQEAQRRTGLTGVNLIVILESRLDNVIFRLGWARSRAEARQLVQHGHFMHNGFRTTIPSLLVEPGDEITVRKGSLSRTYFRDLRQLLPDRPNAPDWLRVDNNAMTAQVLRLPEGTEITVPLNEQLIVEYYSR
jgi:small subunit ribosomal protein S4